MDFPSVIVFIAWLLGGFVSGLTGIGGAMLAVPLAAMFIPMHDVILLSCILNLAMDGTLTCMYLRHCRFSALAPLLAGAIPGAFIGLVILQAVSGRILQGGVGLLLLSYVCWQFFARRSGRERSSWAVGSIAGLGAGVLGTAILRRTAGRRLCPLVRMGAPASAGDAWRVFCPAQSDNLFASGLVGAVY